MLYHTVTISVVARLNLTAKLTTNDLAEVTSWLNFHKLLLQHKHELNF